MKVISMGCSGTGAIATRMLKKLDPSVEVTIGQTYRRLNYKRQ